MMELPWELLFFWGKSVNIIYWQMTLKGVFSWRIKPIRKD